MVFGSEKGIFEFGNRLSSIDARYGCRVSSFGL
jgi:hypothetical protein